MRNLYQFDNFTISGDQAEPVLDLKINRIKSENDSQDETSLTLKNIERSLANLLAEKKSDNLFFIKTILRELSPILLEQESLKIVSDYIAKNFIKFADRKKLDFYLHPANINAIKNIIADYAEKFGYEGKIFLHKDSSLNPCDCRIIWDEHEISYDSNMILQKLEKMLTES